MDRPEFVPEINEGTSADSKDRSLSCLTICAESRIGVTAIMVAQIPFLIDLYFVI